MSKQIKHISKLMSLILRHKPETINVELDQNGWLAVDDLIAGINRKGIKLDFDKLVEVVETNDKKRFIFNDDQTRIRANQGHSISIDLELKPIVPPTELFHGTVEKFLDVIEAEGLKKMSRQHVHLSEELQTAIKVGQRRGKPIILKVQSGKMHEEGHQFFKSENGVWLTDSVPSSYIEFP